MLPVPRVQTAGEVRDLVTAGMAVRGVAAVLSSDLTRCVGSLPARVWRVLRRQHSRGVGNRAVTSLG